MSMKEPFEIVIERIATTPMAELPALMEQHPEWGKEELGLALLSIYITSSLYYLKSLDENKRRGVIKEIAKTHQALLNFFEPMLAAANEKVK